MKRSKHYLRCNVTSHRPSRLVFLDCDSNSETLAGGHIRETFVDAVILAVRRRKNGYVAQSEPITVSSTSEAWDILISQTSNHSRTLVVSPKPVRVLTLLDHIKHLTARGWTLSDPVSSPRFTAIAWRNGTRTLLFISHANLFATDRLNGNAASPRVERMFSVWMDYLRLLDDIDAGDFHLSLGAQSLGIYRHRFMLNPILIHGDKRADELEQRACMGAIYQPYFFGVAPRGMYYYLDTNAMYPWAMSAYLYPFRLAGQVGRCAPWALEKKLESYDCIATVRVRTSVPCYPAREDSRTIFPVGEFNTTLTTPDLSIAFAKNSIIDVYAAAWYDRRDLFSAFVRFFWAKRREFNTFGKPLWASWAKAMMVSLYGRMGAHTFSTRSEGDNPFDRDCADQMASLDGDELRWYHTLAGKMWSSARSGLHRESFPAIMAHIAAYGRNRMITLMDWAGRENVFVCLSDGLIVNQAGYDRLQREIQPDELGMLKLKLTGDQLEILSDVEFRLDAHEWRPGVKSGATEISDGVFVQYLDPNLTSLSRSGDTSEYVKRRCEVHLERTIRTGQVLESGRIVPLCVAQPPLTRTLIPLPLS